MATEQKQYLSGSVKIYRSSYVFCVEIDNYIENVEVQIKQSGFFFAGEEKIVLDCCLFLIIWVQMDGGFCQKQNLPLLPILHY